MENSDLIIKELLRKGYKKAQLIDYKEFLQMYEPYKEKMTEEQFLEVIGVEPHNYRRIRQKENTRLRILKNLPEINEDEKKDICKALIEKGCVPGQIINYSEFLKFYKPYEFQVNEIEFARILGISYPSYLNMKNLGRGVSILREFKLNDAQREEKEKLRLAILNSLSVEKIQNKVIDYQEFLKLYEPFMMQIGEKEFANIIGISSYYYSNIKSGKGKATISINRDNLTEKRKNEIMQELFMMGCEPNKRMTYETFLLLYKRYEAEMTEREFAKLLRIDATNYRHMKNQGSRVRILKEIIPVDEQLKEQVVSGLLQKGYRPLQSICYDEFLQMYKDFGGEIDEKGFAKILGISENSYFCMKSNHKRNAVILKDVYQEIDKEREEQIVQEVIAMGYNQRQVITLEDFLNLYKSYENEMEQKRFAKILGISEKGYRKLLKDPKEGVMVLNVETELNIERKAQIVTQLLKQGYKPESLINYAEFLRLYSTYRSEMSETEFAELIGISYANKNNMKNKGTNARILKSANQIIKEAESKKESKKDFTLSGENIVDDMKKCIEHKFSKAKVLKILMQKYEMTMEEVIRAVEEEYGKQQGKDKKASVEDIYLGEEI